MIPVQVRAQHIILNLIIVISKHMSRNIAVSNEMCILSNNIFLLVMQCALCSCDIVFEVELNVIWDSLTNKCYLIY